MPFTSETARIAGSRPKPRRAKRDPNADHAPQVLLNKALKLLSNQIDKGNVQAASRVLGVLYDAGVKPTTRDDQLGEAMRSLLSPSDPPPPIPVATSEGVAGTEAAKKPGASDERVPPGK